MGDIGSSLADVSTHLPHDTNVLIAVEKRVLRFAVATTMRRLVRFQTGIGEHDNQPFCVFVMGGNRRMLFRHELRELWRRA